MSPAAKWQESMPPTHTHNVLSCLILFHFCLVLGFGGFSVVRRDSLASAA